MTGHVGPEYPESIWISSITVFEARYGIALLASGQRKEMLQERFDQLVQEDLENRVLQFDANAASRAALLAAQRKEQGRPVDMRDTFIAGISLARRATLATRNLRHFDDLPITVVNPWAEKPANV
ncbi:PIN domain-containing protein [Ferrovum myxofaciens]|uniref:PIN domain-containing protein n=1 Tax=Ferrovum myxofaciens TaxID=416213 RepID=UPI003EBBACC6